MSSKRSRKAQALLSSDSSEDYDSEEEPLEHSDDEEFSEPGEIIDTSVTASIPILGKKRSLASLKDGSSPKQHCSSQSSVFRTPSTSPYSQPTLLNLTGGTPSQNRKKAPLSGGSTPSGSVNSRSSAVKKLSVRSSQSALASQTLSLCQPEEDSSPELDEDRQQQQDILSALGDVTNSLGRVLDRLDTHDSRMVSLEKKVEQELEKLVEKTVEKAVEKKMASSPSSSSDAKKSAKKNNVRSIVRVRLLVLVCNSCALLSLACYIRAGM